MIFSLRKFLPRNHSPWKYFFSFKVWRDLESGSPILKKHGGEHVSLLPFKEIVPSMQESQHEDKRICGHLLQVFQTCQSLGAKIFENERRACSIVILTRVFRFHKKLLIYFSALVILRRFFNNQERAGKSVDM